MEGNYNHSVLFLEDFSDSYCCASAWPVVALLAGDRRDLQFTGLRRLAVRSV